MIAGLIAGNSLNSFVSENTQVSGKQLDSTGWWGNIISFIIVVSTVCLAGLYLISRFLTPIYREIKVHSWYFNLLYPSLRIIQYIIAVILVLVIIQIVFNLQFHTGLVIMAEALSFLFGSVVMALLSYRLLSWYRLNKSTVVLLYGLSLCLAAVSTGIIATLNSSIILLEKPAEIGSHNNGIKYNDTVASTLQTFAYMPLRIGFTLYWVATVLLLRNYSESIGQTKFWFLVSLPLAVYMVASIVFIGGYFPKNMLFRIILDQIGDLGAVFFAVIFLTTSRAAQKNHHIELAQHLNISAFGVVLVAVTLTQPVVNIFYPPFAVVDWCFVGLACYLYSIGFYFSAIFISQDSNLRRSIKRLAIKESELLDSIGTAQMEQEIHRKVLKIAKEQEDTLKEQTGVEQSAAVNEQDMKQYLEEVLHELKRRKTEHSA